MHKDSSIQLINEINAVKYKYSEEDTWLISNISSLPHYFSEQGKVELYAAKLLELFLGHSIFFDIDRVALVKIFPHSNELIVSSSAVSSRVSENIMPAGYRCLVNPTGTIFQMKPGTLRIYRDAELVLKSFESAPVQRSISKIHGMSLKSGLCVPLFLSQKLEGLLFLNSLKSDFFSEKPKEFFGVVSLLKMLSLTLLKIKDDPVISTTLNNEFRPSSYFDEKSFKAKFQRAFFLESYLSIPFSWKHLNGENTLVPAERLGIVLAQLLLFLQPFTLDSNELVMSLEKRDSDFMVMKVEGVCFKETALREFPVTLSQRCLQICAEHGFKFENLSKNSLLELVFPIEKSMSPNVCYSVT